MSFNKHGLTLPCLILSCRQFSFAAPNKPKRIQNAYFSLSTHTRKLLRVTHCHMDKQIDLKSEIVIQIPSQILYVSQPDTPRFSNKQSEMDHKNLQNIQFRCLKHLPKYQSSLTLIGSFNFQSPFIVLTPFYQGCIIRLVFFSLIFHGLTF